MPQFTDCDLFNSGSIIEIQKDKKVAGCDLTPANAGQKGRDQLDSKEVAPSCEMQVQGNGYGDSKQVAGAGNGPWGNVVGGLVECPATRKASR